MNNQITPSPEQFLVENGDPLVYEFVVLEETDRLDKLIAKNIPDFTRTRAQHHISSELVEIWLDGKQISSISNSYTPPINSKIIIRSKEIIPLKIMPEKMDLSIIYEDADLIVVNKPRGLVVHPAYGNETNTLVNGLLYHMQASNHALSSINGTFRPGIVHRIDKDTCGLLVVAKNDNAHTHLSQQLQEHSVVREYTAIVKGTFKNPGGTIKTLLGRDQKHRKKRAVVRDADKGKLAITHYTVLKELGPFSLLSLRLETGRTHQIRVHLAHLGHPLLGDSLYDKKANPSYNGQLLCAKRLGFIHPSTKDYMEWSVSLPLEMNEIIEKYSKI
jgi:23S rRNA pseudouridine1911/1915/1917 synthase